MSSRKNGSVAAYDRAKRRLDVGLALALCPLTFPFFCATWLLVRCSLGSPAFFWQARPGLGGCPFQLVKFRTMTDARDANGNLLPDAERLTRLGRALRALSLDELPQLWNILRGDMSFVGPRPLLLKYLPLFSAEQARRHEVRPGLTGWAQVNGRNNLDWEQRLIMDVWYVDNRSIWLDLEILLKSIPIVLRRQDIARMGTATMPEFTGSKCSSRSTRRADHRADGA